MHQLMDIWIGSTMYICVQVFMWIYVFISHEYIALYLTLRGTARLSSKAATPFYFPPENIHRSWLSQGGLKILFLVSV